MGQGNLGGFIHRRSASTSLSRYRVLGLFLLTALFVTVKVLARDFWAVSFGLATLGIILLTPEPLEEPEPWRVHALRIVSACFVVVTLATIVTTLTSSL